MRIRREKSNKKNHEVWDLRRAFQRLVWFGYGDFEVGRARGESDFKIKKICLKIGDNFILNLKNLMLWVKLKL